MIAWKRSKKPSPSLENLAVPADAVPGTTPSTEALTTPEPQPPDAELVVAIFRTLVILTALFAPRLAAENAPSGYSASSLEVPQIWLAIFAGTYNFAMIVAYLRAGRRALRRPFIVAMDATLITLWIQLSGVVGLFPLYYVVVIVAAMWYRTWGGVITAAGCNFFYVLILVRFAVAKAQATVQLAPPPQAPGLLETVGLLVHSQFLATEYALNVGMLFMVGSLVGTLAVAQERERTRRLEERLLLASYQREIDLASQLQPLLMPSYFVGHTADELDSDADETASNDQAGSDKPLRPVREGASVSRVDDQQAPATQQASLQRADVLFGVALQPAREFGGGDYFDLIPLSGGRSAICIADVSGKSVRAQARLPLLKYALRALVPLYSAPEDLMARLSETLAPDLPGELYIGLCYIVLDPRHNKLSWCNAGHIAPLLLPLRPYDARGRLLPDLIPLETCGPALGLFPEVGYEARTAMWRPGDRLLLFTDGLSDALSYQGREDGEEQTRYVAQELENEEWQDPQNVAQKFLGLATEALEDHETLWNRISPLGDRPQAADERTSGHRDDITVVAVRRVLQEENS